MTAQIIKFPKTSAKPVAKHGALIPSNDGRQWHIPIWPGEENDWVKDGYTIISI